MTAKAILAASIGSILSLLCIGEDVDLSSTTFFSAKGQSITLESLKEQVLPGYGHFAWLRPGLWDIVVEKKSASNFAEVTPVETFYAVVVDKYCRIEVEDRTYPVGLNVHIEPLDETIDTNTWDNAFSWEIEAPPGKQVEIDGDTGDVIARELGLYTVSASDRNGTRQSRDFVLSSLKTEIVTNDEYYLYDIGNSVRKKINDQALEVLNNVELIKTNTTVFSWNGLVMTNRYPVYSTFIPPWQQTGSGNVKVFPVSQHILASANHYGNHTRGTQTFTDGVVTNTLTKLPWVNLLNWATNHMDLIEGPIGYTNETGVFVTGWGDISLIPCNKNTEVPDACIPYFMTPEQRTEVFGGDMKGTAVWVATQEQLYAIPHTMSGESGSSANSRNARADIAAKLDELGVRYMVHPGDSGRPVFFMYDGKPVIMYTFFSPMSGPSYATAYYALKAYVEAYGDTLKTIEF